MYSKPPEAVFVTLMMELGVLQFAASAKLGKKIIKIRENRNLKMDNVVFPCVWSHLWRLTRYKGSTVRCQVFFPK